MKNIDDLQEEMFNTLLNKGLTLQEVLKTRRVFMEFGRSFNPALKEDGKYWKNENFKGYMFSLEREAEFIEYLQKMFPNISQEGIVKLLGILLTLTGTESESKFEIK